MKLATCLVKILVLVTILLPLQTLFATTETTVGGSLVATINPKYPKAGDMVNIKLQGYGYDLDSSNIIWTKDRQTELQGLAKKEHLIRMGEVGSQTNITIVVQTPTGKQIVKNIIFRPAEVDLIWEADTYVPEDYRGASLPSFNSNVTISAIPNLRAGSVGIKPQNIIFEWKKDYKNMVRDSGLGKDSFTFNLDRGSTQIELTARSVEFGIIATNKVIINPIEPEILIYPVQPLLGKLKEAVGNFIAVGPEVSGFQVEPYYTPNNLIKNRLIRYDWSNNTNPTPFISRDRTFRFENIPDFEFGSTTLSVKVQNTLENELLGQKSWTIERGRTDNFFR